MADDFRIPLRRPEGPQLPTLGEASAIVEAGGPAPSRELLDLPKPWEPPARTPIETPEPVTIGERDDLLKAGVPQVDVDRMIIDRAALSQQKTEKDRQEAERQQAQALAADWEPITEEELETMRQESAFGGEWEEADWLDTFSDEELAKDDTFSLEAYVSENPEVLQDNAKVDRLANIFKMRAMEPITAKDVAIGTAKLPWTGIKMVAKFLRGTGQTLYDTYSPVAASALGAVTGQGAEFDKALQEQTDKALAEDLAGFEQGSFNFATWLAKAPRNLNRRWNPLSKGWEDIPQEQLREEFRTAMQEFLQSEEIGKGRGTFSRAIAGETLKEIEDRGESLDPERVAHVAEADMAGFFLFGQAFQGGGALAKYATGKVGQKILKEGIKGQELAALRAEVLKVQKGLPASSPVRQFSEELLAQAERDVGQFARSAAAIQRTLGAADNLAAAEARLGAAQAAAKRFGTPEAQAAVERAQAALNVAQFTARGQLGATTLNRLQGGIRSLTQVPVAERVTAAGLTTAGRAAQTAAKVIETAPTWGGIAALLTGNVGTGLSLLVGARALGLQKIFTGAATPLRAAQRGALEAGEALWKGLPNTPLQKAVQGLARGAGDVATAGFRGMPIDVGFGLALAESPEQVQEMGGYGTAFSALHAAGRPLARFTQAMLTGRQGTQVPAFVAPRGGVLRAGQDASQAGRKLLAPEQTQRLAALEQFLNEAGSDTPVYVMPDAATYRSILVDQFRRRNNREPSQAEMAELQNMSEQRGVFLDEIAGDNGRTGSAIFVTDVEAVPHEGAHAFQQVLGRSGNQFVDQIIFDHYSDQWDRIGAEYVTALTGNPAEATNWRSALEPYVPAELKATAGGDPVRAVDTYLAREIAAENFNTLFEATGGRPQGDRGLLTKLAVVADRVGRFFGVDVLQQVQTPGGLGISPSGEVLTAIQRAAQRRVEGVSPVQPGAAPRQPPAAPTAPPPSRPGPTAGPQPQAPSAPSVRPTPQQEQFGRPTPESVNADMAREQARLSGNPEMVRDVETIASALQRAPGEPAVFEAENLSVVPASRESGFNNVLRRAEQAVPDAIRSFFRKRFATTRFLMDQFSGGKLQLMAMSFDKVLANVYTLHEKLAKAGASDISPYAKEATGQLTQDGWNSLIADLQIYVRNQANGYRGGGREIARPEEFNALGVSIPEVNPQYRPVQLGDRVEAFLNTLMGVAPPKTTREFRGTVPSTVKGQVIREAQGEQTVVPADIRPSQAGKRFKSFPEREIRETNLLRDEMKQRGVKGLDQLFPVTERMNMERVQNVTPRFEIEFSLPATDVIRAGFLPRAAEQIPAPTAGRESDPRRIVEAALRHPDTGEIVGRGATHFLAMMKGMEEGRIPQEGVTVTYEDGFVNAAGEFRTRTEAYNDALDLGQATAGTAGLMSLQGRGDRRLESQAFGQLKQFLPKQFEVEGQRRGQREKITVEAEDIAGARRQAEGEGVRVSNIRSLEEAAEFRLGQFAPEERVKLYRGQEGTGEASGVWWTRSKEKAASFSAGGKVFEVEVPARVAELGKQMAEASGQGGDTYALPAGIERMARPVTAKTPVFDLDFSGMFLPKKGGVEEYLAEIQRSIDTKAPRKVMAAAYELSDGSLIMGTTHSDAIMRAIDSGRLTKRAFEEGGEAYGADSGFVDNYGRYLSRDAAAQLAADAKQIAREYAERPEEFGVTGLESERFQKVRQDQMRQFLPKGREQDRWGLENVGKKLPDATYVLRTELPEGRARETVDRLAAENNIGPEFNMVKLGTDGKSVSFLEYPNFDTDPHPALARSVRIDANGTVTRRESGENPPILHRKETFVGSDYPLREQFAAETAREVEQGLLDKPTSTIGTRRGWEARLREKNVVQGQALPGIKALREKAGRGEALTPEEAQRVAESTARPWKETAASKVLELVASPNESILDFGAGKDAAVTQTLRDRGYNVTAHDFSKGPLIDPQALDRKYDRVMASNVLNVQSSDAMLAGTMSDILRASRPDTKVVANYPSTPRYFGQEGYNRKNPMPAEVMEQKLGQWWNKVERIGGTKAEPVWELSEPKPEALANAPIGRTTADIATTPTTGTFGPAKELQAKNIPVANDGGIPGGPIVQQALPREWKRWVDEQFLNKEEVRKNYSDAEVDAFVRGMEMTAKLFGDFSMVPEELAGSPLRSNADRLFRETLDFTTVCPKQDQFVAITRSLERERGRLFTPQEKAGIGEMLREVGQAGCWICYGQSARNSWEGAVQRTADILNTASKLDSWTKIGEGTPEQQAQAKKLFEGETEWSSTGELRKYIDANFEAIKQNGGINDVRLRDLLREEVEPANDFERALMSTAMTVAQGAAKANAPKGFAPYLDQMLKPDYRERIKEYNEYGGQRMNSQSDFRIWHVLDLAQALSHLKSVGGQAHVYTRIPDFVRIFGRTGIKFNASVEVQSPINLPLRERFRNDMTVEQYRELVKEHGEPTWDSMNGFPEAEAKRFREELPNEFGTMLVAADEFQTWWALENPQIDMMIPYHQGSVKPETTAFYGGKDFSKQQHEEWPASWKVGESRTAKLPDGSTVTLKMEGKKVRGEMVRVPPVIHRKHHKNSRENYLAMAEQMGFEPRFARFKDHPNYMKMVRDIAREPTNQQVVDPTKINWDEAMRIVDEWVKSGKYEEETKPNERMLNHIRSRVEANDWPTGPVVGAMTGKTFGTAEEVAKGVGEILKVKEQLKKEEAKAKKAAKVAAGDIKPKKKGK